MPKINLADNLSSRDANANTDALLTNCFVENNDTEGPIVVQRPGFSLSVSLGAGCAQGAITFNGQALFIQNDTIYSNLQPFSAGSSWTAVAAPPKPTAGSVVGTARGGHLVSIGTTLYSLGGHNNGDSSDAIYRSTDNGASWTTILAAAPWTAFGDVGQRAVNFNNTIVIIPGSRDCWQSSDGISWVRTNANITGDGKDCQGLVVHNGLLYAFFTLGAASSVYKSADGITWVSVTAAPAWAGRRIPAIYSFGGNLYLAAGIDGVTLKNDVYKSLDNGATWSQITAGAAFSARWGAGFWVYNSKMWIGGGATNSGGSSVVADVYSTTDGITWSLVTAAPGWTARYAPSIAVHNNTFYIGPGIVSTGAVSSLHFAALGGAIANTLTTPTQNCLPMQIALIPASGATPAKAFIKSTKDAWVWDGTTVTKVTDVDYPTTTVPGAAYLDGAIYVMDAKGVVYGSDLLNPLSWNALNFISANTEADAGVAIARQLQYIIAFKETSIEVFYDAGNATGSPLAKVQSALLEVGMASSTSAAYSENTVYFMANSREKGRSILMMEGYTPKPVSIPGVERILNADDLATVYAFCVKIAGHFFYVLTLKTTAITLAFDVKTGIWVRWTKLTALPSVSVTSLALQSNGSILATMAAPHGAADGDPVTIAGAVQTEYNGTFNLTYDTTVHSTSQFSYIPLTTPSVTPATGTITAVFFRNSYFPGVYYAKGFNSDLLLDELTGGVYSFDPSIFQDNSNPIDLHIRTNRNDLGTPKKKRALFLMADADKQNAKLLLRYSDDDYNTFNLYRPIDLSSLCPRLNRLGSFRRRAWELRITSNTFFRTRYLHVDVE